PLSPGPIEKNLMFDSSTPPSPAHSHISHITRRHKPQPSRGSRHSPLDRRSRWERRAGGMNCKTDQVRAAWHAGDRIGALRIAARFFDQSADTKTFKRGIDAYNNPDFYRQLGKDPERLVAAAFELLAKKIGL